MVKRDLTRKKKPKIVLPRRQFKRAGELSDEPQFEEPVTSPSDVRLVRALNYYNSVDLKDRGSTFREWTVEYMAAGDFTQDEIDAVRKMEEWRITGTIGSISRIIMNGAQLSNDIRHSHDARIREAIRAYLRRLQPKMEAKSAPGPVVDRFRESVSNLIAEVEEAVDRHDADFSAYEFLTDREASSLQAKAIADFYRPVRIEAEEARSDRLLKEAYRHMSRPEINRYVDLLKTIVEDADRYASNKRAAAPRKPRKRKEKSAAQMVKDVRYLQSFPELQLVSIDPASIVGSRSVWLYNVKYKTLRRLAAPEGGSLEIRGSTVHGFDEKASEQRALRKPAPVLKSVLDGTPMSLRRVFEKLTTKPAVPNGRINTDTIILRVTK